MKMVKSLLLGSAAGVVAVTTGQAADLPVKAKPVEYVKVCSLYGNGFYYMPGTDLCIKVGGWVRAEVAYGSNGSPTWGPFNANANQRATSNMAYRARGYITADVRNQTEYGTARAYIAVGTNTSDVGLNTAGNQFSANRAFVQWGGLTAGLAQSFYDFYSVPATSYWGAFPASDTGDPGWWVIGYTLQLGNGFSVTLSDEARRVTQIIDENGIGLATGGSVTPGSYVPATTTTAATIGLAASGASLFPGAGAYGGQQMGDFVGNIRLDQAWGSAQVAGALHQVNATYYSTTSTGLSPTSLAAPSVLSGSHPADAWGWAFSAGLKLNMPMIAQGDYFQGQFNVTQGALRYIFNTPNTNWGETNGATSTFGVISDAVYGGSPNATNTTSLQLTSAWGFNAAYEHYWTPQWRESFYGGYDQVSYNSSANAMLCTGTGGAGFGAAGAGLGTAAVAEAGCNNNWSMWFIGSRLQWDVTKTFYLGVDVLYEQMKSATLPVTTNGGVANNLVSFGTGSSTTLEGNAGDWMLRFRAHRDFLP